MIPPCTWIITNAVANTALIAGYSGKAPCLGERCADCVESGLNNKNKTASLQSLTDKEIRAMFVTDPVERMAIEIHE